MSIADDQNRKTRRTSTSTLTSSRARKRSANELQHIPLQFSFRRLHNNTSVVDRTSGDTLDKVRRPAR